MAWTVVQAVVKANSHSNGKGDFRPTRGFQTPEMISMNLRI